MDSRGVIDQVYVNHVLDFVPTFDAVPSDVIDSGVAVDIVGSDKDCEIDALMSTVVDRETERERSAVFVSLSVAMPVGDSVVDLEIVIVSRVPSTEGLQDIVAVRERSSVLDIVADLSSVIELEKESVNDSVTTAEAVRDSESVTETERESSRVGDLVLVCVDVFGGDTVCVMESVWVIDWEGSAVSDSERDSVTVAEMSAEMERVPLESDCDTVLE